MTDPAILAKVKKLLALATSDQPHEAAAALAKAQDLMAAHGLTLGQATAPEIVSEDLGSRVSVSKMKSWELGLMHTVAKAFGCKVLWVSGVSAFRLTGMFRFLGTRDRVQLATYTAAVLQRKIYAARRDFIADQSRLVPKAMLTKLADGFCTGWMIGVAKPIRELALPVAEREALDAETERRVSDPDGSKRKAKMQDRSGDGLAQVEGYRVGSRESLHRPLSGDDSPILKLADAA